MCTRWMFIMIAALAAACGNEDPTAEPEVEDPAEHACEHVEEAATELAASEDRDDSAPLLEAGDEPYVVRLSADAARYVRVEVDEHAAVILFASAEDAVTGLYHEDDEEELDSAGANPYCEDEIAEHFDLDLHEAGTYYLRLGPSALPEVSLLLTDAEGHAH